MKCKIILTTTLCVLMVIGLLGGCQKDVTTTGEVTIDVLPCWNGSTLPSGVDYTHNVIADEIAKKIGVRLNYLACTTSEIERLNLAFATGDIPDLVSAPFWSGHDGHTLVIKKAAKEGLLMPLNDLIEKHAPNLKDSFSFRLNRDYIENDIEDPEFNGEHYMIPGGIPASDEDVINTAYNVYIRKDIMEGLGMEPFSVDSSEELYELLKLIKDRKSEFKDINGNDVIVSGAWYYGFGWESFVNSYVSQRNMFSSFKVEDNKVKYYENTEQKKQQMLYMRKLISEGLFDVEAMSQTSAIATEKMATGKYAVVGSSYQLLKDNLTNTLYKTNPEMEYVPVGSIINLDGEPYQNLGVRRTGETGTPVYFLSAKNKYPEKTMEFLNFINSEEGRTLVKYGIEGIHHTVVDGKPRLNDEWYNKYKTDSNLLLQEGVNLYNQWIRLNGYNTWFGEADYRAATDVDESYELAKKYSPITFVDGIYSLNFVALKYPGWDDILTLMQTGDGGLMSKAMFAETEEEAISLIEQARKVYANGGMTEFEEFMTKEAIK